LLIKGVPATDLEELSHLLTERWCARVDALARGQWFDLIEDAGGAVRYLSKMLAHGLKAEQAPPLGWKGHRTSQTLGYLVRPASVMRLEARRALQEKRELWKLLQECPDVDAWTAEEVISDRLANSGTWQLVSIKPSTLQVAPEAPARAGGGAASPLPTSERADIPPTETLARPFAGP
jgi:hypothetical protein